MRNLVVVFAVTALATAGAAFANGSGGVGGPAFYVDGVLYRTVGTPTDLSGTGAPAHSFDTLYALSGQPFNVSTVAPGDRGYNGGRWVVHAIAYNTSWAATVAAHDTNDSGDLDSAAEVEAALADAGAAGAVDTGVVQSFVCPVIKL